jgi:amidase
MVPIAHGNDGGGSIRIPAACCGLVGLKAARGRVSVGPDSGESFLVTDGVLTRTVGDTVALLDLLAGYEPGDASWAPGPPAPYRELVGQEPGRLRIGLALEPPLENAGLDPICERGTRDAAALLESLGHTVEEISPPWRQSGLLADFTRLFGPQISLVTWYGQMLSGRDVTAEDVEPLTWAMWEHAHENTTMDYVTALAKIEGFARAIVTFLAPYDVVLTPALAQRPVPIGAIHGRGPDPWASYQRSGYFTPYTAIANVTGLPALAVPLYAGEDGLPLAVHLIGPPAREEVVLRLAVQLEQAHPWAERRPAL